MVCGIGGFKKDSAASDIDIEKWYFVTKIVLTYCEKKMF